MGFRSLKSKALSMGLVVAMAASIAAPVTAHAALSDYVVVPKEPITEIDENVANVAAHRAAETAPMFLGANLKTMETNVDTLEKAMASPVFNVFGTIWNTNPDPYIWNYYYNLYAAANSLALTNVNVIAKMTESVGPTMADGTGVSTGTNADIYLGNEANKNGYTYPSIYNSMAYNCSSLGQLIDTMYQLSYKMNAVPRQAGTDSGRYGDPEDIAKDYEKYIKGVQLYVLSQLEAEMEDDIEAVLEEDPDTNVSDFTLDNYKKKVAIVGVNTNGTYKLYGSSMSSGTAASCRAAEYVEATTYNVIADFASDVDTDAITAAQLKNSGAEYIFTAGVQGNGTLTQTLSNADAIPTGAVVVDQLPKYVYGISMNAVENALGVGIYQSIMYDEYLELEDAVAYFYKDFYHLNQSMIDIVADDYFANLAAYGYQTNKYSISTISNGIRNYTNVLNQGIAYYNNHTSVFAGTKLALTSNYSSTVGTPASSLVTP